MHFSALSYFTNTNNIEYSWQIQDENNKKVLKSSAGNALNYKFSSVGKYIVSLTARSPNGNIDSDSRVISIESRDPIVDLETPKPLNTEKPNTFVFDARKSYDPDTMAKNNLTYTWRLDGQKIDLDNTKDNGAYGEIVFDTTGKHIISLTVANAYGKVATSEREFEVTSTLAVNMLITPSVAPLGTIINFIGQSPNGEFFEWNMGDGTPTISGNKKVIQHIFQKTGVYDVTLIVSTAR
jgi:PKD repeat protein